MARRKSSRSGATGGSSTRGKKHCWASQQWHTYLQSGRPLYRRPLRIEPLEDRRLLALVTVTTLEDSVNFDDGVTSLREAIFAANTVEGADTIDFAPELTASGPATILLSQGELKITNSLTIDGPGAELLTIDGGQLSRIFNVDDNVAETFIGVSVGGLSISGGRAIGLAQSGGGIRSVEDLTLTELILHHNSAFSGGAVAGAEGSIRIVSCTFSDNTAVQAGGGATLTGRNVEVVNSFFVRNTTRFNGGGGLIIAADNGEFVRIEGTTFEDNRVTEMQTRGGGGLYASASGIGTRIEIIGCELINNRVESVVAGGDVAEGGGIGLQVSNDATALVSETTFSRNTAGAADGRGSGGGLYLEALSGSAVVQQSTFQENTSALYGGGMFGFSWQRGAILVDGCEMSGNSAVVGGGGDFGSGSNGRVKVIDSVFSQNTAETGGGLRWRNESGPNDPGIVRTTIDGNSAINGGGIYATVEGNLWMADSTVSRNIAGDFGGGIYVSRGVNLSNVTVSGNFGNVGGGIFASSGFGTIQHSTIVLNETRGAGHGIYSQSGLLSIDHSMVASNSGPTPGDIFLAGGASIAARYSLVGNGAGSNLAPTSGDIPDANGNLIGVDGASIEPSVGALADHGGPTWTHALLPGSPAINAGDLNAVAGEEGVPGFDQRGAPFGRIVGGRMDIGAFEHQTRSDLNLLVDTLVDESDGDYSRGDLSLREAIELANASNVHGVVDTIRFDAALWAEGPATILLLQGELKITDAVTIDGPGAELLAIDGNQKSRIFNVDDGVTNALIDVSVEGLTITRGFVGLGRGGGIQSVENLTLSQMMLHHNVANNGGAVASADGSIRIISCAFEDNTAPQAGGGAWFSSSNVEIVDSEFVRNTALFNGGGGVHVSATNGELVRIDGSVFDDNRVSESLSMGGGGINAIATGAGARIEILRSKVTNNHANGYQLAATEPSGGGIRLRVTSDATALVSEVDVSHNSAGMSWGEGSGGGMYIVSSPASVIIERSTLRSNSSSRYGGGLTAYGTLRGSIVLEDVEISNNSSELGGGAFAGGNVKLIRGAVSENSAENGGGLHLNLDLLPTEVGIFQTTIDGNTATTNGGGIYSVGQDLWMADSTISNNHADLGGGIHTGGEIQWSNVTISGNSANVGGGVFLSAHGSIKSSTIAANSTRGVGHGIYFQTGDVAIENSIVAANLGPTVGDIVAVYGTLSARYSLIGHYYGSGLLPTSGSTPDGNGNLIGSNPGINPRLGELADNGGPTKTHALLGGSPAINAGNPGTRAGHEGAPAFDQRGEPYTRVFGGRIDMGAVESIPDGFLPGDFNLDGVVDAADYGVWRNARGTFVSPGSSADGDGDSRVNQADYLVWKRNFGARLEAQGVRRGESSTGDAVQGVEAVLGGSEVVSLSSGTSTIGLAKFVAEARPQSVSFHHTAERVRHGESSTSSGTPERADSLLREVALANWAGERSIGESTALAKPVAHEECKLERDADAVDAAMAGFGRSIRRLDCAFRRIGVGADG